MTNCPACEKEVVGVRGMGQHFRRNPSCKPCTPQAEAPPQTWTTELRFREIESKLGKEIATLHLHKKVSAVDCVLMCMFGEHIVTFLVDAMRHCVRTSAGIDAAATDAADADMSAVGAQMTAVLKELRNIDKVCAAQAPTALMPVVRPRLRTADAAKKDYAFLSLQELLANVLQTDAESRAHILHASDEWSTGSLRNRPTTEPVTDVVHGQRFRDSPASRRVEPSAAGSPRRVIVAIQCWNDDATVTRAISTIPRSTYAPHPTPLAPLAHTPT